MMITETKEEPKTFKQKINDPSINPKKMFAMGMAILYEVISNFLYYSLMGDPSILFIIVNVGIGILVIIFIGLLRAAYPEEVPDKTIWQAFWLIWRQVVDAVTDIDNDPDTRMNVLEKAIQWDIREWDIAYQEKLAKQIEYYKIKLNENIKKIENKL